MKRYLIVVVIGILIAAFTGTSLADDLSMKRAVAPLGDVGTDTSELLIFLKSGTDADTFGLDHNLQRTVTLRSDPNGHVFAAPSVAAADALSKTLGADGRVRSAYLNRRTSYVRYAFTPNDPLFDKNDGTGFYGQWHLVNPYVAGRDARVQGAWGRDVTGSGVTIGIVDDSFETTHEDLSPNYVAADSWDFGDNDANPDPVHSDDRHGISVAGVAAGRGGNSIGITGAAPYASLAGLRIDFPNQTTAMFVDATKYHSTGSNTNIDVKNHSYGISAPYIPSSAEETALANSVAAGTIHLWAAGNERGASGQDSNKKDLQNSPDAIAVAALGSDGTYASYSNFGANVFVTTPSNTSGGYGITTTDRTGSLGYNDGSSDTFLSDDKYTSAFGGTSSATPLASGVVALGVEVQGDLDTRFVKHLLVKTSDIVDATDSTESSDGGWTTNAAGNTFNQNYGFGLIDADEFTQMAAQYTGVTPLTTETTGVIAVGMAIPDNDPNGVSVNFALTSSDPLEEVLVDLDVTHTYRGDLQAYLTSPSGTTSRLMIRSGNDSTDDLDWTFIDNAFWGEDPAGQWTLSVSDNFSVDTGTWNSYAVTARMGELVPEPATLMLMLIGAGVWIVGRRRAGAGL